MRVIRARREWPRTCAVRAPGRGRSALLSARFAAPPAWSSRRWAELNQQRCSTTARQGLPGVGSSLQIQSSLVRKRAATPIWGRTEPTADEPVALGHAKKNPAGQGDAGGAEVDAVVEGGWSFRAGL